MNNVSLDAYSIFKDVYENRNIAQTANKLNVSPSSVSYRIKMLEEMLNIKLFERKSFGVEPTACADELYYNINVKINTNNNKLKNLLDMVLNEYINKEEYKTKKEEIVESITVHKNYFEWKLNYLNDIIELNINSRQGESTGNTLYVDEVELATQTTSLHKQH